jgi:transposase-like protein
VQRFTPLLADAARFCRHAPGDKWFVDETYVKINGVWRYVYRARHLKAGRHSLERALCVKGQDEVLSDGL